MWRPPQRIKWPVQPGTWPTAETAAASRLFSPLQVGPMRLEQRTWIPAMVPWRATEDGFTLVECFAPASSTCVLVPACGLAGPLAEALAAFMAVLDGYVLADMIAGRGRAGKLRRLLADDVEKASP